MRVIDANSSGYRRRARANVQFKETGIRLTVTPHVTNNRQVLMQLHTERSAIQPLAAADLGFIFRSRRPTTSSWSTTARPRSSAA